MIFRVLAAGVCALVFFSSCGDVRPGSSHGPIVLGDPATIVTETDSQYLQDMVPDHPAFDAPVSAKPSRDTMGTATSPVPRDTVASAISPAAPAPAAVPVLTADFGDVQIGLPGVQARTSTRSLRGAGAAAYTLDGTAFSGKNITVSGGSAKRIQQRTGYSAVVEIGGKSVLLGDAGTQYTGWQNLQGRGGNFTLANQPAPAFSMTQAKLRAAVQKAARAQRLSRAAEQKLLASVRSVGQAPVSAVPRAYTWKIEGTDASGKAFSKEVRVDVPL